MMPLAMLTSTTWQPNGIASENYAVSGDPLTQSVTDSSGTITSVGNLLGQTVSYTDVWGTVTTPTYNLRGQVTSVSTTTPGATRPAGVTWRTGTRRPFCLNQSGR
jgi:YD repeat-containing protein